MIKKYLIERDGQIDFFNSFRIDYINNPVLVDNTDGIWNGNILEFKLYISDINSVLFQVIKYLSRMRIKGESIPANIILISLNESIAYIFKSQDYFNEIHQVYFGPASKNNKLFIAKLEPIKIEYDNQEGAYKLLQYLKMNDYMPIELDENCIVGWAERYYRENPKASKGDFLGDDESSSKTIGEIREPRIFKNLIIPYKGKTNEKFKYLMDKLNDNLNKKKLGAYYTPIKYCEIAAEMVREAIKKVPNGNRYIILDRCAGTGNLESVLTDEELSHCILSTYEYYEYKVLCERLGDKVLTIIPPIEMENTYDRGFVSCADATSEEYINNPIIKQYLDDDKCTIILLENPPYSDDAASTTQTGHSRGVTKDSFVAKEFNKNVKSDIPGLIQSKDIANLFIWSGFKYYLRQQTDAYILFSPIKYWKTAHLVNKTFIRGYLFNREHFHANPSAISCIYWQNKDSSVNLEQLELEALNIVNEQIISNGNIQINKVYKPVNQFLFDKRKFDNDEKNGVWCARNGKETGRLPSTSTDNIYNTNILAYLHLVGFAFDPKNRELVRTTLNLRKNGFYLRKDRLLYGLPLFCAKCYPQNVWYHTDVYSTTADGGNEYEKDKDFLIKCLFFTSLTQLNHCLSFNGSDGRFYKNELCFDGDTLAYQLLKENAISKQEGEILGIWELVLREAKKTSNYNCQFSYGLYQIIQELNTYKEDKELKKRVYDYPILNGYIETLKSKMAIYYKEYIEDKLFKYQLLK